MIHLPTVVLLGWIPISLYLFYRLPIRIAILLTFICGWALLPNADYVPTRDPFPYWFLGLGVAGDYILTKATITGFCGLLGLLIFDRHAIKRITLTYWDIPMII